MKMKKYKVMMAAAGMLTLTACANLKGTMSQNECDCEHCQTCPYVQEEESTVAIEDAEDILVQNTEEQSTEAVTEVQTQPVESTAAPQTEEMSAVEESTSQEQPTEENKNSVAELTEGEKAARKQQQANFAAARELLYTQPNSLDKTQKINEIDKQILANNSFDFSGKTIQFFGDSITEAICGAQDESGNRISYVDYANNYLQFGNCLNNGKAGRMFTDYGGAELSFSLSMGDMYTSGSDISVIFLGVNDYLTNREGKRYGDMNAVESTAGYIGSIRYALKLLKANYPNQEIFFVTTYNISKTANSTYTDVAGSPQLNEYMDVLSQLVKESGYHLIEIYDTGFMDCTDPATNAAYTADSIHPNDAGNRVLGEHIAAELSLYYSQRQ